MVREDHRRRSSVPLGSASGRELPSEYRLYRLYPFRVHQLSATNNFADASDHLAFESVNPCRVRGCRPGTQAWNAITGVRKLLRMLAGAPKA